MARKDFIEKLAPYAIQVQRDTDIAASLTIAQGCLESADGRSGLTIRANNLFGIKGTGNAGSVNLPTKEQRANGSEYTVNANFASFTDWGACVAHRTRLLLNGVSWNRNLYKPVIGKRGREAAYAIQACGYATDINYARLLIGIMDAWNLYKYDEIADQKE